MFGWRKKRDGFEWHDYVRTTILVRRAKRRQRVDEVRQAAADGLKDMGAAAAHGLNGAKEKAAAGLRQAGEKGVEGAAVAASAGGHLLGRAVHALRMALAALLQAAKAMAGSILAALGGSADSAAGRLLAPLAERRVRLVLGACGIAAAIAAGLRVSTHGADARATVIAGLAALAILFVLLAELRRTDVTERVSPTPRRGDRGRANAEPLRRFAPVLGWGAFIATVVLGLGHLLGQDAASVSSLTTGSNPKAPTADAADVALLTGRAQAISGDTLRLQGRLVRLQHIESPERGQSCQREGGKPWKCGERAKTALADLIRGGKVQCAVAGTIAEGLVEADCRAGSKDLGEALVRDGHVFSQAGLFARHGSIESEARSKRLGIWSGVAPQRPAAYRAALWEEAKKAAPEGCPIKGEVSVRGRVYVTPWMSGYERAQVRPSRGGRWFCSEEEARSAGWMPSSAS